MANDKLVNITLSGYVPPTLFVYDPDRPTELQEALAFTILKMMEDMEANGVQIPVNVISGSKAIQDATIRALDGKSFFEALGDLKLVINLAHQSASLSYQGE